MRRCLTHRWGFNPGIWTPAFLPLLPLITILQARSYIKSSVTQQCIKISLSFKSNYPHRWQTLAKHLLRFTFCSGHINYFSIRIKLLQSGMKTPLNVILEAYCFKLVYLFIKNKTGWHFGPHWPGTYIALAGYKCPEASVFSLLCWDNRWATGYCSALLDREHPFISLLNKWAVQSRTGSRYLLSRQRLISMDCTSLLSTKVLKFYFQHLFTVFKS